MNSGHECGVYLVCTRFIFSNPVKRLVVDSNLPSSLKQKHVCVSENITIEMCEYWMAHFHKLDLFVFFF